MERKHIIIGLVIFIIFTIVASGDEVLTRDERIVALTLLGEARGEGKRGMYAVGCVIQKRASERNLTPAKVCLQPYQFSIWNAGEGKVKKESELHYLWKSKSMMYARELARGICKGKKLSQKYTGGANHYCTLNTHNKWTRKTKAIKVIGNHKFFKLP
jgi:spore germination cell wall hydrolase CwlJ-like protein